jgi:hypothetical protein
MYIIVARALFRGEDMEEEKRMNAAARARRRELDLEGGNPPWKQPRGKWMVSSVNSRTNATLVSVGV